MNCFKITLLSLKNLHLYFEHFLIVILLIWQHQTTTLIILFLSNTDISRNLNPHMVRNPQTTTKSRESLTDFKWEICFDCLEIWSGRKITTYLKVYDWVFKLVEESGNKLLWQDTNVGRPYSIGHRHSKFEVSHNRSEY